MKLVAKFMLDESSDCIVCGGKQRRLHPFGKCPLVLHCRRCGNQALWPMPLDEEIQEYYSNYPTTKTPEQDVLYLAELAQQGLSFYLDKMGHQTETRKALNFLEIGFGNAAGLFAAAHLGLIGYGIDLDPACVTRARDMAQKYAIPVHIECGDVSTLPDFQCRFHIVKASQVIEHVKHPLDFLKTIATVQQTGDFLIIECPNNKAGFWWFKNAARGFFGRENFYNSLKITEHLWGYNKKSLPLLLAQAGYQVSFMADYAVGNVLFQPETLVWYPSLRHGFKQALKEINWRPLIYPVTRVLDQAFSLLMHRGTGLALLCQKTSG